MARRKPFRYENPLLDDRPIRPLTPDDFEQRMAALFEHYGIARDAPNAFAALACSLAMAHVPGFQPQKSAGGAPEQVTAFELASFIIEFTRLKKAFKYEENKTILRRMADDHSWRDPKDNSVVAFEKLRYKLEKLKDGDVESAVIQEIDSRSDILSSLSRKDN